MNEHNNNLIQKSPLTKTRSITKDKNGQSFPSAVSVETNQEQNEDAHQMTKDKQEKTHQVANNKSVVACDQNASVGERRTVTPTSQDILLGRGKPFQNHPGNLAMHRLAHEYKDRYKSMQREKRGIVAKEVLHQILDSGTRFLKVCPPKRKNASKAAAIAAPVVQAEKSSCWSNFTERHYWEVASKGEAYEKLCHALRTKCVPGTNNRCSNLGTTVATQQDSAVGNTTEERNRGGGVGTNGTLLAAYDRKHPPSLPSSMIGSAPTALISGKNVVHGGGIRGKEAADLVNPAGLNHSNKEEGPVASGSEINAAIAMAIEAYLNRSKEY